jgi:acyl-CoA reductase-like NAD-dependent aldehyde dehydrogenase
LPCGARSTPRTHGLIVEAFGAVGFREGAVNLLTHAPQEASVVVGALIDHPAVRRINFTGSAAVCRIIAKRAAEHLKRCLLELGGNAPLIVLEDADLDEAVTVSHVTALTDDATAKAAKVIPGGKVPWRSMR